MLNTRMTRNAKQELKIKPFYLKLAYLATEPGTKDHDWDYKTHK